MGVSIAEALQSLARSLQLRDVPLWRRPASPQPLQDLRATLAPLELADDLVSFWTEVDIATLRVGPYPPFIDLARARETWTRRRDEFSDIQPLALVDVGYESHAVLGVELTVGGRPGGAVYAWWVDDPSYFRCFDGLGDWIAVIAALVERGACDRFTATDGLPWLSVNTEQTWSADPAKAGHYHLPVGVTEIVSFKTADSWPPHWRDLHTDR